MQRTDAGRQRTEDREKDLALVCPPGRRLCMTLLCSIYLWSVGVMEYWKNKTQLQFYVNLNRGHWDSLLLHIVHER